ncbi:unnamed protein product, partial [Rotaria sp. Silwood1]
FSTPFQPHPSTHFNTHAYMIQAQHGPPQPPPSMHHHQLGKFPELTSMALGICGGGG